MIWDLERVHVDFGQNSLHFFPGALEGKESKLKLKCWEAGMTMDHTGRIVTTSDQFFNRFNRRFYILVSISWSSGQNPLFCTI